MKYKILLIIILFLALFLRLYKINIIPPGLSNDEISIAYEAYSLINTGRDSTGVFFPLSFKSHNDYKAPLYFYVVAPVIKILGNNEIAVRLPSVIFGTLTVLGIYLLIKKISSNPNWAILSAFLLAITPWHIYTSRIALESSLALFLVVFGVVMFLEGIGNRKYLMFSSIFFALSLYAYHTQKVFTPLLLVVLTVLYFKKIKLKDLITAWTIFMAAIFPLIINIIFFKGGTRAENVFFLNDFLLANNLAGVSNIFFKAFIIFSFWFEKLQRYLSFDYIFGNGLPISAPYGSSSFGLLNILEFPLFLVGTYHLISQKNKLLIGVIFGWFFIGPFAPSIALGQLDLIKNLISLIPWTIISAYGLVYIWEETKNRFVFIVCLLLLTINSAFFYRYYIKYFPIYYSQNWSYGFKQIAEYAKENENLFQKIVIDWKYGVQEDLYGAPSLFVLYFNGIDPMEYLNKSRNDDFLSFNKYEFRNIDWPKEIIQPETLYVVGVRSAPVEGQKVNEVYSINLLDGKKAFKFYKSF